MPPRVPVRGSVDFSVEWYTNTICVLRRRGAASYRLFFGAKKILSRRTSPYCFHLLFEILITLEEGAQMEIRRGSQLTIKSNGIGPHNWIRLLFAFQILLSLIVSAEEIRKIHNMPTSLYYGANMMLSIKKNIPITKKERYFFKQAVPSSNTSTKFWL